MSITKLAGSEHDQTPINVIYKSDINLQTCTSLNNRLIVEKYTKEALRSKEVSGFAFVDQKLTLKGLKTLIDAKLTDGTLIRKGTIAFIKEEVLHTAAWAQKSYTCDGVEGQFLIVDINQVEFVEPIRRPGEI
jgi:hypothetical protein